MTAHEATKQMIDIIRTVKAQYEQAEKAEKDLTDECNDLNHALELLPLTKEQRRNIGEELGEVRWRRRQAKDDMEQLEPLVTYLRKQRGLVGELNQIYQDINTTIQAQSQRYYTVRIRKELGEVIEHRARDTPRVAANAPKVRRVRGGIA